MRGRGVASVPVTVMSRWSAIVLGLALILTWPGSGAGTRVGDHRVAISLAVQVDASAAIAVGA